MSRFSGAREAKEFLVTGIVAQAQREGVPISEVERKMLYFSETAWTLPGIMEVSNRFDRECDPQEYEKKIARLIRNARKRARKVDRQDFEAWSDAIRVLSEEDHYLLVMVEEAGALVRPRGDLLKLWGAGLAVACIGLLVASLSDRYIKLTRESWRILAWAIAVCVAGAYPVLCAILGRQNAAELIGRFLGLPGRRK